MLSVPFNNAIPRCTVRSSLKLKRPRALFGESTSGGGGGCRTEGEAILTASLAMQMFRFSSEINSTLIV